MNKLLLALLALSFSVMSQAGIVGGKTYKIASASDTVKALFVENAAMKAGSSVVIWTDTNVPAQQWRAVANTDGTFDFVNVYTQGYLTRSSSSVSSSTNTVQRAASTSNSHWTVTAVEGSDDTYTMTQKYSSKNYYLQSKAAADGDSPTYSAVVDTVDAATAQMWVITEVSPITSFNSTLCEQMIDDWLAHHLQDRGDDLATIGSGGGWGDAEMLETLLDAYETTGEQKYIDTFREVFNYFKEYVGSNYCQLVYNDNYKWYGHEFNDDVMWMILASVRAYLLTGTVTYRTYAKSNFDKIYSRALNEWGMMRWKESTSTTNGTNSCINGPTEVAACYLAMALTSARDKSKYYEIARSLYENQRRYLFNSHTGAVYDSFTWDTDTNLPSGYNTWVSTYNQGTMLGAAVMLYNYFGDEKYRQDADRIAEKTQSDLCNDYGIVNVCQTVDGDLCGFKGILMRYMRRYAIDMNHPEIVEWLHDNAMLAYNNRNSAGITSSAWLTKAAEDFVSPSEKDSDGNYKSFDSQPFGNSTAAAVAANANIYNDIITKDAFSTIEAEQFDHPEGIYVTACTDGSGSEISSIKNNRYATYDHVVYGSRVARSVQLRVGNVAVDNAYIEVRLDGKSGTLLGKVPLTKADGYQTVTADIVPTDGTHSVCLLFRANASDTDCFTVDNFVFLSDTQPLPNDITDSEGELTSSVEGLPADSLIDNRATTTAVIEAKTVTLGFNSVMPVKLKGYAIANGGDDSKYDPAAWTVEASSDAETWTTLDTRSEQTFSTRCAAKNFNVSTDKEYSYFRVNVSNANSCDSLVVGEWQLFGEALASWDITSDGGTLLPGTSTLIDKNAATYDNVAAGDSVEYKYSSRGLYQLTSYSITSAPEGNCPQSWTLYGQDGSDWVVIDQQSDAAFHGTGCTQFYKVSPDATYQNFKLVVKGCSNGVAIAEWQMFGPVRSSSTVYADITDNGGELSVTPSAGDANLQALIDNDVNSCCALPFSGSTSIVYHSDIPVKLLGSRLFAGNDSQCSPKTWTVEASNDGQNWTTVNSSVSYTFRTKGAVKESKITNTSTWTYVRLTITAVSGNDAEQVVIGEWQIHGTAVADQDLVGDDDTKTAEMDGVSTDEGVSGLFDKSSDTKYCFSYYGTAWMQCESDEAKAANLYSLTAANDNDSRDPYAWELQGSDDGSSWTTLDARSEQTFYARYATQFYAFDNSAEYKYYRLQLLENNGATLAQIGEWQLFYNESIATGIDNVGSGVVSVSAYPNPVVDVLNISLPTAATVYVYNGGGQAVSRHDMEAGTGQIDFSARAAGLYIIKVVTATGSTSLKVVK